MVLLSLPDSAFVSGAVSDSAGVFTLQATADNIRSVEVVHNPGAPYEESNSQMLIRAPYTQHDLNLYYDEQAG